MGKLIADIGGTNARFALVENGDVRHIEVLACNDYPTPAAAANAYLKKNNLQATTGAFAVATPIGESDQVSMTNHVWSFSIRQTANDIGLNHLTVLNDFTALALAVPQLSAADYYKLGDGAPVKHKPIGIIGAGTGLGVGAVVFDAHGNPIPVSTEGGHVTMPATTQREFDIFEYLKGTKYHHISAERVISGKGIVNLYNGICGISNLKHKEISPEEITRKALNKECKICEEVLDIFCYFLGIVAGNLALTYGAAGGIFVAGGIVPQLGKDYFSQSRFRLGFTAKGRFTDYLNAIPTYVVTHPYPGLEGLKAV